MLIVAVTVLLNFVLDPLFIFGWGPIPAMGVAGAAMATLCTQALAAVIGFALLFSGRHGLRPPIGRFSPRPAALGQNHSARNSSVGRTIDAGTRLIVMTLLVSSFGNIAVAAYGVGVRIITFVIIPAMGLAMATTTIVGQNIGAGKLERAERTNRIASLMVVLYSISRRHAALHFCCSAGDVFVPKSDAAIAESAQFIHIMSLAIGCNRISACHQRHAPWRRQHAGRHGVVDHRGVGDSVSRWRIFFRDTLRWVSTAFGGRTRFRCRLGHCQPAVFVGGDWKRTKLVEDLELEERVREEARIDEGIAT